MFYDELREALAKEQRIDAETVCRVMAENWGGSSIYVPKKYKKIEITYKDTPKTLMAKNGISRRTAQNWINKWRQ